MVMNLTIICAGKRPGAYQGTILLLMRAYVFMQSYKLRHTSVLPAIRSFLWRKYSQTRTQAAPCQGRERNTSVQVGISRAVKSHYPSLWPYKMCVYEPSSWGTQIRNQSATLVLNILRALTDSGPVLGGGGGNFQNPQDTLNWTWHARARWNIPEKSIWSLVVHQLMNG